MKKLFIVFLLLGSAQAFGMKRHLKPGAAALLASKKYSDFFELAQKYQHISWCNLFNKNEKQHIVEPIKEEISKHNTIIKKTENCLFRKTFGLLLPTSAALLIATMDPILMGTSLAGLMAGSYGFKQQCDLFASRIMKNESTKIWEKLHNCFKKPASKTK